MKDIIYIRHDVNSSQDPKIVKIRAKFGPCAYAVYWCALESIRNEDSITLSLEDTDVIAYTSGVDLETVNQIVNYCIAIGLFTLNGDRFTSDRLVRDVEYMRSRRKNASENGAKGGRPSLKEPKEKQTESKTKAKNNQYSIVKDSIEENSIVKDNIKETPNPLKGEVDPFAYLNDCFILHPEYLDTVKKWLTYKKEKRQAYKSLTSIQTMVNRLVKDSNNDPLVAAEMIDTAIANNWAGFFASKDKDTTPKESIHIAYEYALCMAGADNQKDRRWFLKEITKYPAEFIGVLAWYWRNAEPGEMKRIIVQHLVDEYADKKGYRRNYAKKTPEQHMAYWTEKVEKMRNEQK